MLRTLAVIIAVSGCTLVGLNCSGRLRRRRDALAELVAAVRRICIGVTHTNRPLAELLRGCGEQETGAMFAALADAVEGGHAPLDAWIMLCEGGEHTATGLMERDIKALTVFFSVLGASDRNAQIENAQLTLDTLEALRTEAETAYTGKGRVYRTMGVLLGVGVGILLL